MKYIGFQMSVVSTLADTNRLQLDSFVTGLWIAQSVERRINGDEVCDSKLSPIHFDRCAGRIDAFKPDSDILDLNLVLVDGLDREGEDSPWAG